MTTQENMLARHRILHELGRGAIGAVYAARDRTTGAVVALKRLDPELLKSDASFAERFLKQARSARRLKHRNIVRIHDAGEAAGTAYVAMEMLEGENLRSILERGPLPIARAIRIAHEIACGLAYAHLEGVIHGGLKPSNIMVLRSGVVKITDFGIGQLGQAALLSGARAGWLGYLSPEQLRGEPVDHRCDLFSLGALCYEMLTHRRPFEGDSPKQVLENIRHAEPPPPSELNQHVPRALDAIVLSMLAAQPAARMAGIPVLLRELEGLEEGLGLGSGASAVPEEPAASVPPAEPKPAAKVRPAEPEPAASAPPPGPKPAASARPAELKPAASMQPAQPEPALRTPEPKRFEDRAPIRPSAAADAFQHRQITDRELHELGRAMREREASLERSSRSRPGIAAALALMLVAALGIGLTDFMGVTGFKDDWSGRIERVIASTRTQQPPATPPSASRPAAPAPVAEARKEPATAREDEALKEALTAPALPPKVEPLAAPVARAPREPVTAPPAPQASPPPAVSDGKAEQPSPSIASAPAPKPGNPIAPSPVAEVPKQAPTAPVAEAPKQAPTAPVAEALPAPAAPPPAVRDRKAEQPPAPAPKRENPIASAPAPKPKPIVADPGALALLESLIANVPEQPKSIGPAPAKQLPRSMRSTAKVPAQKPGGTAMLILAVSPRGELYINGEHHGTTPPITTFDLEPGLHRIEVRSGSRKPYVTYMAVEPGDVRRIRHDFDAKWSRPPS